MHFGPPPDNLWIQLLGGGLAAPPPDPPTLPLRSIQLLGGGLAAPPLSLRSGVPNKQCTRDLFNNAPGPLGTSSSTSTMHQCKGGAGGGGTPPIKTGGILKRCAHSVRPILSLVGSQHERYVQLFASTSVFHEMIWLSCCCGTSQNTN